jgi:hypothetical protein
MGGLLMVDDSNQPTPFGMLECLLLLSTAVLGVMALAEPRLWWIVVPALLVTALWGWWAENRTNP